MFFGPTKSCFATSSVHGAQPWIDASATVQVVHHKVAEQRSSAHRHCTVPQKTFEGRETSHKYGRAGEDGDRFSTARAPNRLDLTTPRKNCTERWPRRAKRNDQNMGPSMLKIRRSHARSTQSRVTATNTTSGLMVETGMRTNRDGWHATPP